MSVKIGISPISWQNDDLPDLTAAYTMEQALSEAREIGYTGVERGRRMPSDTAGLGAYLTANGLSLCGGWCSGNLLVNDVTGRDTAVAVGAFGIGNVAVGRYHSCSVDSATATSLTCWGRTYFGNGSNVVTLLYPQAAGRVSTYYNNSTAISTVVAGSDFTCALLKTSGDVQCWGAGASGQIGNGGTADVLTPTSTSAGAIFWKP